MADNIAEIPIRDLTKDLKLVYKITGFRGMRFRLKIAIALMNLVSKIIGCKIELDETWHDLTKEV